MTDDLEGNANVTGRAPLTTSAGMTTRQRFALSKPNAEAMDRA